jgi:hypothetical protein
MKNLLQIIFDHYWRIIFLSFINTPDEKKVDKLNEEFLSHYSGEHSLLYLVFNKWKHIQYLKHNGIKIRKYIPPIHYDFIEPTN